MEHNLGGIERPIDERDFLLGSVQAPVAIPQSYTPDISWLTTNFQGQTPACGAHAASHFQAVLEHQTDPFHNQRYTPRYSWIKVKTIDGFPLESGTDMRSIFKSLQNNGADDFEPLENDVALPLATYSDKSVVTPDMDTNASTKKIQNYAFGGTDFQSLCQHIYQNKAVLLLIKVDNGYWGTANPAFTNPEYGHFVAAYGYTPNSILLVDSADQYFPLKEIAKQYITSAFIKESGTAVEAAVVQQIVNQSVQVANAVVASPVLSQQTKVFDLTSILNFLKSLFSQKVEGTASQPMTNYNAFLSKTNWTLVATIVIAVGNAVTPFMSNSAQAAVTSVLLILAGIFHVNGVNKAAVASADATAATATGAVATPKSGQ